MVRNFIMTAALAASVATALVPSAAMARDHGWSDSDRGDRGNWRDDDHGRGNHRGWDHGDRRDHYRYRGGYDGYSGRYAQSYGRGYYRESAYEGDGRYGGAYYGRPTYRCGNNGSAGTIIGAIAGGLIGNGIAGRGDRTLGTILGGGAGALAGHAIDRSDDRC